jgi:hypothetical protein
MVSAAADRGRQCQTQILPARARRSACGALPAVLLTELDAFFTDHHAASCKPASNAIVWIECPCGAGMARRADERDALAFDG